MRVLIIIFIHNKIMFFRIGWLTWWNKKILSLVGTEKRSATHPSNESASKISSLPFVTGITDSIDRRLNKMRMTSCLLLMFGVYTLETIYVWQCVDWGNIEVKRDFRRTGMRTDLLG